MSPSTIEDVPLTLDGARLWLLLHAVLGPGQENCACMDLDALRNLVITSGLRWRYSTANHRAFGVGVSIGTLPA